MLFDLRTYRTRPGTIAKQLQLYAELGFDVQRRHLGEPVFYGTVESGDVNSYVHLWKYETAADREARRKALYEDAGWRAYREESARLGYQTEQTNSLLRPAPFWLPPKEII